MNFTRREIEVLKLISEEKTNEEIAHNLNISISTVESHKRSMFRKNGVHSSLGLIKEALKNGYIKLDT